MINVRMPEQDLHMRPRITVVGIGGAGGNAVNNMIRSNLEGVEFLVTNTDAQSLTGSAAEKRIQLGTNITRGLGAGSRPDIGRAAAEEALEDILSHIDGVNMVFITAGMGGGTGTGAAPVIARAAREQGILTVGVVTKPFHFEGQHRMRIAEQGIQELQQFVDTLLIIPNQNLFRVANEKTTFADAFKMADDVLYSGVRGVTDLMVMPGLINLDFADIRAVMSEMGKAMMGTGEADGDRRSIDAAEAAISNPLLDDVSMKGARGVLINITGGHDMTLFEVDEAANRIRDEVDPEANIIFGSTFEEELEGKMRVSVVATGIDAESAQLPNGRTANLSLVSNRDGSAGQQGDQKSAAMPFTRAPVTANRAGNGGAVNAQGTPMQGAGYHAGGTNAQATGANPTASAASQAAARMAQSGQGQQGIGRAQGFGPVTTGQAAEQLDPEAFADPRDNEAYGQAQAAADGYDQDWNGADPTGEPGYGDDEGAGQFNTERADDQARAEREHRRQMGETPRPERDGDAFLPPRPMDPGPRPTMSDEARHSADPFAAAAMANGAGRGTFEQGKKRAQSLFERFTGIKTSRKPKSTAGSDRAGSRERHDGNDHRSDERDDRSRQQRSGEHRDHAAGQTGSAHGQDGHVGGGDHRQRQARFEMDQPARNQRADEGEDDLLEIPAFLRRQAN